MMTVKLIASQTCPQCQRKFFPQGKRGPRPKYCGPACKQAAWRGTWPDVYAANKRRKTRNVIVQAGRDQPPTRAKKSIEELIAENERLLTECRKLREELRQ